MSARRDPRPRCDLCGEAIKPGDMAEMYDPSTVELTAPSNHYICHAECGLSQGFEVA